MNLLVKTNDNEAGSMSIQMRLPLNHRVLFRGIVGKFSHTVCFAGQIFVPNFCFNILSAIICFLSNECEEASPTKLTAR